MNKSKPMAARIIKPPSQTIPPKAARNTAMRCAVESVVIKNVFNREKRVVLNVQDGTTEAIRVYQ
jgi:hypothetical protein